MAKRPIQPGDNRDDLELKKFLYDPSTKESWIRFDDQAIIDAINSNHDTAVEIKNESLVANTEKSINCGSNVKYILIKSRNSKPLQLAYSSGQTTLEYISLPRGTIYTDNCFYSNLNIYLLCEAADVVEILIKRNT